MCDSDPESGLCDIFTNYTLQTGNETKALGKKVNHILIRFKRYKQPHINNIYHIYMLKKQTQHHIIHGDFLIFNLVNKFH